MSDDDREKLFDMIAGVEDELDRVGCWLATGKLASTDIGRRAAELEATIDELMEANRGKNDSSR